MADQPFQFKFVQAGEAIDYTPGSDVAAGKLVTRGNITGVTHLPILANVPGALEVKEEVYDVVKAEVAFSDGDAVYWQSAGSPYGGTVSTGAADGVATGRFIGFAIGAKLTTDPVVRVLFQQAISRPAGTGVDTAITDPGNGGAIPVTTSGRVAIVTTGAQTRTLAAPSFAGQELLLYMKTDGGDCVITCATGINQTGNNTITMNDAGDSIRLVAIESGSNIRWRVVVNDGCTLATV